MRTVQLALALLVVVGCGARTELMAEAPPDAGRDAGSDASFFATFPCRWSLGEPLELAEADDFADLTGAVHPIRRYAAVSAVGTDGTTFGARILLQHRAERLGVERGDVGALFTGRDGWLRQLEGACVLARHDEYWDEGEPLRWGQGGPCVLAQSLAGRVESVALEGMPWLAWSVLDEPDGAVVEDLEPQPAPFEHVTVTREADGTSVIASVVGATLSIQRVRADGTVESLTGPRASQLSAAPDRLRGGVMLLFHDDAVDAWRLERLAPSSPLALRPVADLAELPAPPVTPLVSNETEAILALENGAIAYVPLSRDVIRLTDERAEEAWIEQARVILRPGDSLGGLLYVARNVRDLRSLRFRAMVCNR